MTIFLCWLFVSGFAIVVSIVLLLILLDKLTTLNPFDSKNK